MLGKGAILGSTIAEYDSAFDERNRHEWGAKAVSHSKLEFDYLPGDRAQLVATKMLADLGPFMDGCDDDTVTIIGGDRAFMWPVCMLKSRGIQVELAAWQHSVDAEVLELADAFRPLDFLIDHFSGFRGSCLPHQQL